MKIKQKITTFIFITVSMLVMLSSPAALAATDPPACQPDASKGTKCCGGAKVSILGCSQKEGGKTAQDTGVWGLIIIALNIMTAGVGVLAVGGVAYASILYASSSDNAEQTKQAKQIIKNVAIGILAYAGMYLMLNFLIPGGIFS